MDALHFGSAYKVKVNLESPAALRVPGDDDRATERVKKEFKHQTSNNAARQVSADLFYFAVPDEVDATFEAYLADAFEGRMGEKQAKKDGTPVSVTIEKDDRFTIESAMDCAAAVEQAFGQQK